MSMSDSIPVSMLSIVAVLPMFCHQGINECAVGEILQQDKLSLRINIVMCYKFVDVYSGHLK